MREHIRRLIEGNSLSKAEATDAMEKIMTGGATPAQIGAFLVALRTKGETVEEIVGFAECMRRHARRVKAPGPTIDTCGTGGDSSGTFNISTAAALVAAGAGATVAKHGNRSVSSSSGSADVLAELGVAIDADVPVVERCLERARIGFLFAPLLHGAMKHAIGPRREIGVRTVFNILGPLTNPAGARRQLLGVFDGELTETIANVLAGLGSERAVVVHSEDGLDELTTTAPNRVTSMAAGSVTTRTLDAAALGLPCARLEDLRVKSAKESAEVVRQVLDGKKGPARDIVLLNAAGALMAGGEAQDWKHGLKMAAASIDGGGAKTALETLIEVSCAASA